MRLIEGLDWHVLAELLDLLNLLWKLLGEALLKSLDNPMSVFVFAAAVVERIFSPESWQSSSGRR